MPGVVLLNKEFLRKPWPMWELRVMMAALRDTGVQPQLDTSRQAARTVVPVILMDHAAIEAVYEQHWQPAMVAAARDKGLPPATLEDVRHLLSYRGIARNRYDLLGCSVRDLIMPVR